MDLPIISLNDTHATTNRIPEKGELSTLRDLAQQSEKMIQGFQQKKEDVHLRSTTLRKRYEEQLRAMEATISEIHASERFESMLDSQISLVQCDLNRLRGLIHPIRRCPSDILRCIFEWVVEVDELIWQTTATGLSHVCRRWRVIALETPSLWNCIQISTLYKPDRVTGLWTQAAERMKNTAPHIIITDIAGTESESKFFELCRFDLFPHIKHLEFQLRSVHAATRLVNSKLCLPKGPLDTLEISRSYSAPETPDFTVEIATIVNRFPTARAVTISNIFRATFAIGIVAPKIVKLQVDDVSHLPLRSLIAAFPSVEIVKFGRVTFVGEDAGDILWPSLQSVTLAECGDNSLGVLKAPNLIHYLTVNVPEDFAIDFISSHPSLKHLDVGYSKALMESISQGAHKLISFTTDLNEAIGDPSHPKLGGLDVLGLYQLRVDTLSLTLFDKIVRNYCLPNNEGDVPRCAALRIIVADDISVAELEWRTSRLLSSAVEQCSKLPRWNEEYTVYTLRWA